MRSVEAVPIQKIYLLAEHRLLRESLMHLLEKRADVCVVGVSRCCDSTTEQILESQCQILLSDSFTEGYSRDLINELLQRAPQTKVILFGMDEDPDIFVQAVRLGVSGYIVKDASAAEMVGAVRAVAQGEAVCTPDLCMALFQYVSHEFRQKPGMPNREARIRFGLTYRQSQLVELVAQGLTNKEIAASLNLSEFTVKNHMRRIMRQVDAESRFEAVDVIRTTNLLPNA